MNFTRFCSLAGAGIAFVLASRLLVVDGLSAVTFYEDNMCSGVPSLIIFSPDSCQLPPDAANTSCQAQGNSMFSVSSCPDDYTEFTAKAFGPNNPFLIEQAYYGWGCSAQYVNAGSANGVCHINPVDNTSFRAGFNDQGGLVFLKYFDSACGSGHCATSLYKTENFGWLTVGGFNGAPVGEHTAVTLYENNSCAAPAVSISLTSEQDCTPQIDHYDPVCMGDNMMFTVSDCTKYYAGGSDGIGIIDDAFGDYPHLIVEKYLWCGFMDTITDVMVYRLDENCYSNAAGNESHKLTLGRSVTITTYADANCMDVVTEITVDRSTLLSGGCGAGDRKLILANTQTAFTVVAIYEDSTCSGIPSQISFTPTTWCDPVKNEDQSCQSVGSRFSLSGCTYDYAVFATTAFGANNPFVIEEAFVMDCNKVGMVTTYLADGICHADLDGSTSFIATIDTADTVVLRTFHDSACNEGQNIATLTKDQLMQRMCMYENCYTMTKLCAVENCYMWWGCSRKFSVGGLGGIPSMGKKTIVAVYEDTSCSAPAVFVTLASKLTCTPQDNHYVPVCATDGTLYSVSDCTRYLSGGWDDIGIIADAFGDDPYLIMEKYVNGWCGSGDAITDVTIYRLDNNCYPDTAGTASHRLMLGHALTITTYADANCTDVTSTRTVEQSMLTTITSGNCVDNDKKFFVINAQPVFTATTIYKDSTCSGTPSQIIFSRDFACQSPSDPENIPCQVFGNSLFSVSSCASNYSEFTTTTFGANNAFVLEQASSSWSCTVESATAYSADGACHINPVDYTSFRARIDSQGTLAFYKYYDSACTSNRDAATFYKTDLMAPSCMPYDCNFLPSLCSRQNCNYWYSCRRIVSVGGPSGAAPTGKYSAVVEYADRSCSDPVSVSFTNELSCTPQSDHYDPVCIQDGTMSSASDCTQYYAGGWDDIGIISEAFGKYPYLVVEKYLWCGMMDTVTDVMVYRLDENCYPNAAGNESHKLTLGRSVTITTYADANCMDVVTEITVDRSTLLSGGCGAGDRKLILANTQTAFTVVAIYEDSTCSGIPSQISFIPAIGCHNVQDSANAPCEAIGNSLFSMSSCTNDYSTFAITAFGVDNPFVIEQGFTSSDCMNVGLITTYSADDICHTKSNGYRSFRATLDAAGTLTFRTFHDSACKNDQSTATLAKYQLISPMCTFDNCDVMPLLCSIENCYMWWMCGRKLSIGGLDSANAFNSAVTVFDDSSCAQVPVQIVVKKQLTCSTEVPSCKAVPMAENTMYQDHACIEDVATFAKARFSSSPYLIMEKYKDGTSCEKQKVTVVYKADGLCYTIPDGTSFRVLSSFGESVTFASYPTASCNDDEAEIIAVGSKYINTGACYDGNMRLYGDVTTLSPFDPTATCPTPIPTSPTPTNPPTLPTPTPSVNFDQKTREEIMFPEWLWEPTPHRIFAAA